MSSNNDADVKLSTAQLLEIYALSQQATVGDCNIPRPTGCIDIKGKAKWDAWNSKMGMSKEEAQRQLNAI